MTHIITSSLLLFSKKSRAVSSCAAQLSTSFRRLCTTGTPCGRLIFISQIFKYWGKKAPHPVWRPPRRKLFLISPKSHDFDEREWEKGALYKFVFNLFYNTENVQYSVTYNRALFFALLLFFTHFFVFSLSLFFWSFFASLFFNSESLTIRLYNC